ncbi:MAG: alpha/beta hydrolase fold protein [Myxococcales bacterium]|nr:alpha/beta hydrolase fold protein [Myxococcales bacterium]
MLLFAVAFAAACAATPPPPAAPAVIARVTERPVHHVDIRGVDLAWDSFGDEHAPPMVLIMGLGLQLVAWDEAFCTALAARGFRVIRFDNRDVGLSTHFDSAGDPNVLAVWDDLRRRRPVTPAYRIGDMADDTLGLLDALAIPAAHLVGVSMGGMIAQQLAIDHPDRVLSLTSIMSTTGDPSLRGPSFEVMGELLPPFPADRDAFLARSVRLAHTLHGPGFPFDEDYVRRIAARSFDRGYSPGGVHRQLVAILSGGNRHAALTALRKPALVIHGDADPLLSVEGGRDTAAAIPGARLVVIPGMGHELPRPVWPRVIEAVAELAHLGAP